MAVDTTPLASGGLLLATVRLLNGVADDKPPPDILASLIPPRLRQCQCTNGRAGERVANQRIVLTVGAPVVVQTLHRVAILAVLATLPILTISTISFMPSSVECGSASVIALIMSSRV